MRNLAKIYGKNWKVHYDTSKREVLQNFVGGLVGKAVINEDRHVGMRGGLTLPPNSKCQELKHGGSNEVSDCQCGSSSLRSSIRSLTVSESSDSVLSQTSIQSPIHFRTPRLEYPMKQISDYTDLYNTSPVYKQTRLDEFRAREESEALFKRQCAVPTPGYSANISSNGRPSFTWEMERVDDIDGQDECKVQLASTARNLFGWTGVERSFRSKLRKQSERRSKQEDFEGAI